MIARVHTVIANTAPVASLVTQMRDDFERIVRPATGCTGGLVLVDETTATVLAVSLWDDNIDIAAFPALPIPATATERDDASGVYDVSFSGRTLGAAMARVTVVSLTPDPDSIDRGIHLFMNSSMMHATAQGGFRRGLLLVDRATNRAITIGLWESQAAIEAGEASGYSQSQLALYAEFIAAPPTQFIATVALED